MSEACAISRKGCPCDRLPAPIKEVISWSDKYVTGLVFLTGLLCLHMIFNTKVTVVSLVCILGVISIIIGYLRTHNLPFVGQYFYKEETDGQYPNCIFVQAIMWKKNSFPALLALIAGAIVFQVITGKCLIYLAYFIIFSAPAIAKHFKGKDFKSGAQEIAKKTTDFFMNVCVPQVMKLKNLVMNKITELKNKKQKDM